MVWCELPAMHDVLVFSRHVVRMRMSSLDLQGLALLWAGMRLSACEGTCVWNFLQFDKLGCSIIACDVSQKAA